MNVTVAIDSFKGSLSTSQSGAAVADAIRAVYPDADVKVCPLADGGEGTVAAIVSALDGERCAVEVCGPLGERVVAEYGVIPHEQLAVIEMSAAAGITLVPEEKRNPLDTTTYGVGQLIRHAIEEKHCRHFLIGIGGSATNDGGLGMLSALGFRFLDRDGNPVSPCGRGLRDVASVCTEDCLPALRECRFEIACDVTNPLCGEVGCSRVYGPQKGATETIIRDMDAWLAKYAAVTKTVFAHADADYPGAGAAGGLGFAFLAYLGASLTSGIELVIRVTELEKHIKDADVVVTGEGRLDAQSCMGKAPVGVAKVAKKYGKPVIAFSGAVTRDAGLCNQHGIDAFFPIVRTPCSLKDAMDVGNAYENLKNTAEQAFRLIKTFSECEIHIKEHT